MANTRIKDISTAATTLNSDDFIAVDGSTAGTRKMAKADLISEVSSGVSGTYLEESNNLSDVASLDTSKLNMEIPDVGSSPDQVSLNGMLGDMAFQSSDGVSAAKLQVESTTGTATTQALTVTDGSSTNFVVQEDGSIGVGNSAPDVPLDVSGATAHTEYAHFSNNNQRHLKLSSYSVSGNINAGHDINASSSVGALSLSTGGNTAVTIDSSQRVGIGTTSPGSYYTGTDDLVVAGASGDRGITIATANTANGGLMFADSDSTTIGRIQYSHGTNEMKFRVNNTEVWSINSSGNLVANGTAIDFGSGASTTIDAYEHGDITSVTDASGASLAITADMKYQVIGKSVQISGKITFPTTTDTRAARVTLLPEQCPNDDGARGLSVSYTTSGSGLYVMPIGNTNDVMFWNLSGTSQQNSNLSGLTIFISGNYSLN